LNKVQYITQDNAQLSHSEQALAMFKHGISWVQLRMKEASEEDIVAEAKQILKHAEAHGGTLILNDSVELAKRLGVKAVHLGLNDMPIDEARQVLGKDVIIGGTANTLEQVKLQVERGADYVGVGPFRFTTTKKNLSPTLGLEGYEKLLAQMKKEGLSIPLFAVGGITTKDMDSLEDVGVGHFAMSGEVLRCHLEGDSDTIKRLL
jgi:thiamine-phosphate pyrophosphorylase